MYPWFGDWGSQGSNPAVEAVNTNGSFTIFDGSCAIQAPSGNIEIMQTKGSPPHYGSYNGGKTWPQVTSINYGQNVGSFNGSFVGGGNYMSSNSAYSNSVEDNGWTTMGTSGSGYSFGPGSGGWVHDNIPVWVVPYSYGGAHYVRTIAGPKGTSGVPSGTWTDTNVKTAAGNGSQAKVAVYGYTDTGSGSAGGIIYAGYTNTTPSTSTFFMTVVVLSAVGTPITTVTLTPPAITGLMQSFVSIGYTLILTTADNKIYTSTNGGGSWTTGTSPFSGTSPLAVTSRASGRFIAYNGVSTGNVLYYQSVDGVTWTQFLYYLAAPGSANATSVAVSDNGFILAGNSTNTASRLKGYLGK